MNKFKILFQLVVFVLVFTSVKAASEDIVGKWISAGRNVIVEVYREHNYYNARLIWFDDGNNRDRPMNARLDVNNPDKSLRQRKLIGMIILKNLTYNASAGHWENGQIYDCRSGKMWNSTVWMENERDLKVRGFFHFQVLGQTMSFSKV